MYGKGETHLRLSTHFVGIWINLIQYLSQEDMYKCMLPLEDTYTFQKQTAVFNRDKHIFYTTCFVHFDCPSVFLAITENGLND